MATKCPYCAEEIKAEAKICPHCRKNLREKTGKYQLGSFIMAAGLLGLITGFFIDPVTCSIVTVLMLAVGYVLRKNA